jgi:nucleoside-diphosphate-sugar epimerase
MLHYLFCFGLGYTCINTIKMLNEHYPLQWQFSGTKQSDVKFQHIKVFIYDELIIVPYEVTHILISIPPKEDGDFVYKSFRNQIKQLPNLRWIGYLSTTGVYGDHHGDWVDENSPINPQNPFAKNRAIAEEQWLNIDVGSNVARQVFRLSGIYGEGRSVLERLKTGNAKIIDKPGQYFSRIHVDDISQVLIKSMYHPMDKEIFNVSDDYPCSQREITEYGAKLLNLPIPEIVPFEKASFESEMGKYFFLENKRVKNSKIKEKLGVDLLFPTYKEGLNHILKEYPYLKSE